jgi:tryptophanyl-tRNA synthetase
VAERFNQRYGETFRVPDGQFPEIGGRIMDLQEPTNKMSTSTSSEQGAVYIADSPDAIRKKFKTAVTDSEREIRYDPKAKPGVSNLIDILSVASGRTPAEIEAHYGDGGYGQFKQDVGEAVVELLAPIQERFAALRADERELQRLLAVGAEKARNVSQPTLEQMYERMGFAKPEAGRFFGAVRPRGL